MPDNNAGNNVQRGNNLLFSDESRETTSKEFSDNWKLMIVDDEEEVHKVTHLGLKKFSFDGRGLEFLSAYSGAEAKKMLNVHPDVAVILLDVVMETDTSGLDIVRFIRDEIKNPFVRIILRTGHPGQAPEQQVIKEYDINDYKEKTDLTRQKLYTVVMAALRSFSLYKIVDNNRKGLEQIIQASDSLFRLQSLKLFASGVLKQITSLLNLHESSIYLQTGGFAATKDAGDFKILAATGQFEQCIDSCLQDVISDDIKALLERTSVMKKNVFNDDSYVGYFSTENESESLLYLKLHRPLNDWEKNLVNIFSANVSVAFDNVYHRENLENLVAERTKALKKETEKVLAAHRVLAKFVPPQLTERILSGEIEEVWDHCRRRLTMFFSDIKDFTKLAEVMEPEDMAVLLNQYLSEMYEIANKAGGVVANVMGDGLFIFFGAPETTTDKEQAIRCVRMALEMQKKMKQLQTKWFEEGVEDPLEIRCGINTGIANVGGFGSKARRDYTAMGLQVNLASRLEGQFEPGKILVSHTTWALVKDEYLCRPKGRIEVKGFSHPVRVYEVTLNQDE